MVLQVNNSYSKVLDNKDPILEQILTEVLTYQNDIQSEKGQLFYQLKLARKYGNTEQAKSILWKIRKLEENEFVCLYRNGAFPSGLLNIVLEVLRQHKSQYEINDLRVVPSQSAMLRWENKPFPLRPYQEEMVAQGLKHGRGVFSASVGSGKSVVMAYLIKELSVKSLIVVPSRSLSDQLYNDFVRWFGSSRVEFVDAKKIRTQKSFKPIRIITIQSLGSLQKSGDLNKLIRDIDSIHCDEFHHSGSQTYSNLLKDLDHVYYKLGYTGTFLRNDSKTLEMWGFLSNTLYNYPASRATREGYLTPIQLVEHVLPGKYHRNYQKEYDANYCNNPQLLEKIHEICGGTDPTKQILILVNRKDKCGKIILEYLNMVGIENSYISGDDSKEVITASISLFNQRKFRILIGSSVISEGIDVRSTDHLILCNGGKSEIVIVQSTGRAVRLYEGKEVAYIHDFRFENTEYLEEHFLERKEIITRNFL